MRKFIFGAAAIALAAMGFVSCNSEDLYVEPKQTAQQSENMITISASTQSDNSNTLQKAELQNDMKSVYFSKNEEAKVFFYNAENTFSSDPATFTGNNDAAAATTDFFGSGKAELAAADHAIAYIPASQVSKEGEPTLKAVQTAKVNGFDPEAFIASGTVDKEKLSVEFQAEVAFLKITADGNYDITVEATGICGSASKKTDEISMKGLEKGNTYFVAVWPGEYEQITITDATNKATLREIKSVKFTAGKVYSVRQDIKVTIADLVMYINIPNTATKIVFDYSKNVDTEGMTLKESILDNRVNIYNKNNSTEYYVLSDGNICMTGSLYQMFWGYQALTTIDFNNFNTAAVTDMSSMFFNCTGLTSLDLSGFNTAAVTSMSSMFEGCSGLTSLNLSGFNTAAVTNMSYMFENCSGLTSLNLSGFNTAAVTSMSAMFENCSGLTSLNLSSFNTSAVTEMDCMFAVCSSLKSLDLSVFSTQKVESLDWMFAVCSSLETIFASSGFVNNKSGASSDGMFAGCSKLKGGAGTVYNSDHTDKTYARIDGGEGNEGYFTAPVSVSGSSFNSSDFSDATKIVFGWLSDYDVTKMTSVGTMGSDYVKIYKSGTEYYILSYCQICMTGSLSKMFNEMSNLTSIEFKNFNTAAVTGMSYMFFKCSGLTCLDLSGFSTGSVTNMSSMFEGCSGLTTIYASSNFVTKKVILSLDMFTSCNQLVGGAGTEYKSFYTGKTYARIDGGPTSETPGYFTAK